MTNEQIEQYRAILKSPNLEWRDDDVVLPQSGERLTILGIRTIIAQHDELQEKDKRIAELERELKISKAEKTKQRCLEVESESLKLLAILKTFLDKPVSHSRGIVPHFVYDYCEEFKNDYSDLLSQKPSQLLTQRDLEQQAKGVRNLIDKHVVKYGASENPFYVIERDDAESFIKQLRKQAGDL